MSILLISDVHLCMQYPNITNSFLCFLHYHAIHARALYILGDLFEIWLGDDDHNTLHISIAKALKNLTKKNISCYFIHGNHDFLLGKKYAESCGMKLLPSKQVLKLESGKKIVVLHGDILCTSDNLYRLLRKCMRNILIQRLFLLLPLNIRMSIFNGMRFFCAQFNQYISKKRTNINLEMITKILTQNNAEIMIHGHTHKPEIYNIYKSEKDVFTIMTLGRWDKYGSIIEINEQNNNITFLMFPLNSIK